MLPPSSPARFSAGVSSSSPCAIYPHHPEIKLLIDGEATRNKKATQSLFLSEPCDRVRKPEHFNAPVGFRVGQGFFLKTERREKKKNWFGNKRRGDQDVCVASFKKLNGAECTDKHHGNEPQEINALLNSTNKEISQKT